MRDRPNLILTRGKSTLSECPARLGLRGGLLISRVLCFQRLSYGASQEKNGIAGKPASNSSAYDGLVELATAIIIKKFR